ncbi:MAG: flagellar M-ring protein FliF [Treponema sp.]|jgi:flagellar M-ring protein FliF|nr:flagellar M-ring protein FliF [Treponema sp.]
MNEWLKKFLEQIKTLWTKWSLVQKLILIGIVVAAIAGTSVLFVVSSAPSMVPVIDAPIRDEATLDRIITRINAEGVRTSLSSTGVVMVQDDKTAKQMRAILIREDLVPANTSPWEIFDRERWTITDFERNVNLQRAITDMIIDHLRSLDDIDDASVTLVVPQKELFASQQDPTTASIIITPRPGSDIVENRKKIEGIQKLVKNAVQGLTDENITITDSNSTVLNDFEGMQDFDRLTLSIREQKFIRDKEIEYRKKILSSLQSTFTAERVRDLDIKIDMDMSKKMVSTTELLPTILKADNPNTPYDDSLSVESIPGSLQTTSTNWEGTGFNPEGPPGVEGQTTPVMRDMSNLYGTVKQETHFENNEISRRQVEEEKSPTIDRVTVSVNIDGQWIPKYDEEGNPVVLPNNSIEREYIPIPADILANTQLLIQDAIGYNQIRGDSVSVQNIPFDRTREFAEEDAAYFQRQQFELFGIIALSAVAALLIIFIAVKLFMREMERRRRLREEELSRQHQMMRESALRQAEEEGVEVSMSVEERKRMELQENAINMAKEHPEDVAQLIRTWLLEE